jgi:hypothetical protein
MFFGTLPLHNKRGEEITCHNWRVGLINLATIAIKSENRQMLKRCRVFMAFPQKQGFT